MGGGPDVTASVQVASFAHLLDPKRKWYNNKRSAGRLVVYPNTIIDQSVQQDHPTECLDFFIVFLLCFCRNRLLLILSSLITSSTIGYDGSMMNGLQSLPQWQSAFNNPSNGMLGVLNAITVGVFFRTANHNF